MDILHLALNFPQLGYFSLCQPSASDICTWEKSAICAQLFKKKKGGHTYALLLAIKWRTMVLVLLKMLLFYRQ